MFLDLDMGLWYNWILCVFLLIIGVFFLVKASDMFVDGSSSVAKRMKISPLIIGLTIVAFGTSLPELAVSVSDSFSCLIKGDGSYATVAIGNVVGSNMANILLVIGFSVLFTPIIVKRSMLKKEFPILIFVSILLAVFALFFGINDEYAILRLEGVALTLGIILYVTYLVIDAKRHKEEHINDNTEEVELMSKKKSWLYILIGFVGIVAGGEAVVLGATNTAYGIGKAVGANPESVKLFVGLTVVAVGTSLPELVTSIVAAKKGENEIALGNVVGSNIFNILFVLGISATVNPLVVSKLDSTSFLIDLGVMLSSTLLLFILAIKGKIGKLSGVLLLLIYVAYVVTRIIIM